jgi:hypothetical protein
MRESQLRQRVCGRPRWSFGALSVCAALFSIAALIGPVGTGSAADPCVNPVNPIPCENSKPGTPIPDLNNPTDPSIQGFADKISVTPGQTEAFKVNTDATAYRIEIYRIGWYGGDGARLWDTITPSATLPQAQPPCGTDTGTGLVDCGNWAVSASWQVPANAVSGVYAARLVRSDNDGDNLMLFIVRDDSSHSDLLFQTSDETWVAYNQYGGTSLYNNSTSWYNGPRAVKVSYNRPLTTRAVAPSSNFFDAEYPMVRWLERNGYDVSYFTGVDTVSRGSELRQHKVFMSVGHDEYWSAEQRTNVENARDAGVNLAFFSANEIFWKTRWEPSIDGSSTPFRTLVSYKETLANAKSDPSPTWTGSWRDPTFSPPADGGRPENALTGTIYQVDGVRQDAITIPAADGQLRFWRNTGVDTLAPGTSATLGAGTLGYEWDEDRDNGFRPAGLIDLSHTTVNVECCKYLIDYGGVYDSGVGHHSLTLYRASSGALVFGAGTVQWDWALDAEHDAPGVTPPAEDRRVQQATVNLLADMGAQPATRQANLVAAAASTDTTPPSAAITSPAGGATLARGQPTTITGTAADAGGGGVGGVEISTDGGHRWHPATGRSSWSYTWLPSGIGSATIMVRASDDSANLGPATSITVNIGDCPCSLWADSTRPAHAASGDSNSYELGVKIRSDVDGFITGIRFYKGTGNGGTHLGHLWSASGTQLGETTFTNETASGWQQASFRTPVPIKANTTYVVSYFAPTGNWAYDRPYFVGSYDSPPLHAPGDAQDGPNGVYKAGGSGFPTSGNASENFWVDAVFSPTPSDTFPPSIVSQAPGPGSHPPSFTDSLSVGFDEALNPASVSTQTIQLRDSSGNQLPGNVTYSSTTNIATLKLSSTLTAGATYTATVRGGPNGIRDVAGNALPADVTWSFTVKGGACPCSLWSVVDTPTTAAADDGRAYELGVKFRSDLDGYINGIRFYKGPGNTGAHVGHLWDATGTQLAQVTFTNETASGWQQALFSTPVRINASTTYIASYFAPNGHFSLSRPYFSPNGYDNEPLHGLKDGLDGPNGVYAADRTAFPTSSYAASNYWVDVVYDPSVADRRPPTIVNQSPAAGARGVPVTTSVTAQFDESLAPATVTNANVQLRTSGGSAVDATISYTASSNTISLAPSANLDPGTTYTAVIHGGAGGVTDVSGNALAADASWSFTTVASCPCTIWGAATPAIPSSGDGSSYELGVRFRSDADGYISGIRFYKGSGNTGTHVGHLWTNTGTQLGQVTFTNETASGWQQALFSAPVHITPNTTYVASYYAPNGNFSLDRPYFTTPYDADPLHALRDGFDGANGIYKAGSAGFPTSTYGSSNYWVDVVFTKTAADLQPPSVLSTTPANGASGVSAGTTVTARFDEALDPASVTTANFDLRGPAGIVPSTVTYDAATQTATLTPSSPLGSQATYTAVVHASGIKDAAGNPVASDTSWSFTTAKVIACPCRLWASTITPATPAVGDGGSYELGVRFRSDMDGFITGIRFYKGSGNTGTHIGHLWTNTGTQLGQVTFTGESATGWQEATFATAIPVTANTTYVASYFDPNGHFSLDRPYFAASTFDNAPLHALKDGLDGANGVYKAGSGGFPTSTYAASNYWVDVVFAKTASDTRPPNIVTTTPAAGSNGVSTATTATAQADEALDPSSVTSQSFQLLGPGGAPVAATVAYNSGSTTMTLAPTGPLADSTTYTAVVHGGAAGVKDLAGNSLAADVSWTFTTANAIVCPCSIWSLLTVPSTVDTGDGRAYELGVRFRSDVNGYITGIRFYKAPGNTGVHRGHLWTGTGTQLGEVIFTNETSSSWQQAMFTTPIPISANTTYVASYFAPSGHYSLNRPYFGTATFDNPPLHALRDGLDGPNGVFNPDASAFPTGTYQGGNYWVDVVFATSVP